MDTADLNDELHMLQQATDASEQELRLLEARLKDGRAVRTIRELHDTKSQIGYLRLLLRQVGETAARVARDGAPGHAESRQTDPRRSHAA